MLTVSQAVILGFLQGLTELFPISSLGHSIILTGLFGWKIDRNAADVLGFLVATHLATALTLFFFYWNDWLLIIKGIFRSLSVREIAPADTYAKLGWLLVVGTIPVGLAGLIFEKQAKQFFTLPVQAAWFLILNGAVLFAAEMLRRRAKGSTETLEGADGRLAKLTWGQSLKIGSLQILALFPGISRTGAAMTGGILNDLSHEDALRFSFLLATPVIGAAALLELPGIFALGGSAVINAAAGAAAAALTAYLSVKFLIRYFKTRTLIPFAAYCALAGILVLALLRR